MLNLSHRHRRSILVLAAAIFPLSGGAMACENWDLGDSFKFTQANGAFVSVRNIDVNGSRFEASAKDTSSGVRGDLSGSISSDGRFKFTIEWDNGSIGLYTAHIDQSGEVLDGRTYDKTNPSSWSTWRMRPISCND